MPTVDPLPLMDGYRFSDLPNGERVLGKATKNALPALGWNSWHAYGSNINETKIKSIADSFIRLGLDKLGYEYVVIDDGCYTSQRVNGRLSNNANFPKGFKEMSDYIHSLGLKFGMYNDVGFTTCAGQAGMVGNEDTDAQSFAEWGVDYLKIDYCNYPWDRGGGGGLATRLVYCWAPRIRGLSLSGGGGFNLALNAVEDGTVVGCATKSASGNYVDRIGTLNTSYALIPWGELEFHVNAPADGTYNIVVTYATHINQIGGQDGDTDAERAGRWLQVAVGESGSDTIYFDELLPATANKDTFTQSAAIPVSLKAGDNLLRIMNHRRQENVLMSYAALLDGLNKAGVGDKVRLSICEWGQTEPWFWGYKVGDSWRTWWDITFSVGPSGTATWGNIAREYNETIILDEYAGLDKGWNDPDMMVVGMGGVSERMGTSHMTLWCMLNSPIMLGYDLNLVQRGDTVHRIISNADVLALNQDPLGIQAKRIYTSAGGDTQREILGTTRIDVIAKPLANGDVALTFINLESSTARSATVDVGLIIEKIGHKMVNSAAFSGAGSYMVKDLWTKDISITESKTFSVTGLAGQTQKTIRITPITRYSLGELIAKAESELQAGISSAKPINPENTSLTAAIDAARVVYDNSASTDEQIQNAILGLTDQLNAFKEAYSDQTLLTEEIAAAKLTLSDNEQYFNRISIRAAGGVFNTIITQTEALLNDPGSDGATLKTARSALSAAVAAFKTAVSNVFSSSGYANIPEVKLRTHLGAAPQLPSGLLVDFSDGASRTLSVVWDAISPEKYNVTGVFEVEGAVADANIYVSALVTVFDTSFTLLPGDDIANAAFDVVAYGKPVNYLAIMALYDRDGRLVNTTSKEKSLLSGECDVFTLEIGLPRGYKVSAFLWDASTYVPLLMSQSFLEPWEVDKSAIPAAADEIGALDLNIYTRLSSDRLLTALEEAMALYHDEAATRPMVKAAMAKINAAKDGLEKLIIKLDASVGTYYGRAGEYSAGYNTWREVFDGDITTYFDSNSASAAYVGIDLGAGNEMYVSHFRFHPRSGQLARMNGTTFRGSMTQNNGTVGTVLHTVSNVSVLQWYTVESGVKDQKFRYIWLQSGTNWYGNVSELEFYGSKYSGSDITLLEDRIAYANTLTASGYTSASWLKLQTALAGATTLTSNSPQESIDSAAANLKAALAQLEPA